MKKKVKVLSVRQPWAWLIVNGPKRIENRNWNTNYRGELYIHASQRYDRDGEIWIRENMPHVFQTLPPLSEMQRGGVVGICDLVDVVEESSDPWFFGPYGYVLKNRRPIKFIPLKGWLGVFTREI